MVGDEDYVDCLMMVRLDDHDDRRSAGPLLSQNEA